MGGGYYLKSATIYYGILKGRVFEVCAHLMLFPLIVKEYSFANFEYSDTSANEDNLFRNHIR